MWDDAQALRKLTLALLGVGAALLIYGVLYAVLHSQLFALRSVTLTATPQRVPVEMVMESVRRELRGNFFTVDLERVRHGLEKLPWVRTVVVRRHFPWQLELELEEQVALAQWNGTQSVNDHGEVFDAMDDRALPEFNGPEGSAAEVVEKYRRFSELLAPLQQEIARVDLSPRRAWRLSLREGMELELGREQMEERLARFVAAYPLSLSARKMNVRYVDLRYRDGFAARISG